MTNFKHGDAKLGNVHPIHNRWRGILKRCNSNDPRYGGRGIDICPEWKISYIAFKKWALGNGWKDGLSIDRIDNDKGYSPANCRFTTNKEQARNRRSSKFLTLDGEKRTAAEWSDITGISQSLIWARINRLDWTVKRALTQKVS